VAQTCNYDLIGELKYKIKKQRMKTKYRKILVSTIIVIYTCIFKLEYIAAQTNLSIIWKGDTLLSASKVQTSKLKIDINEILYQVNSDLNIYKIIKVGNDSINKKFGFKNYDTVVKVLVQFCYKGRLFKDSILMIRNDRTYISLLDVPRIKIYHVKYYQFKIFNWVPEDRDFPLYDLQRCRKCCTDPAAPLSKVFIRK